MARDQDVPVDADAADNRIGLTGARFRFRPTTDQRRPAAPTPPFQVALRGYARQEVDDHLARTDEQIRRLHDALRDSEHRRARTEEHMALLESELADARSHRVGPTADERPEPGSVGHSLLRQAQRDAARIRAEAARDARLMLSDARAEITRRERTEPVRTAPVEQRPPHTQIDTPDRRPDTSGW
ncbi:MAG: hypothetical protein H7Y15_12610 [Pseudonocardia sp.]|nr:hypothetical protein [Pseudonocardia sp.]